MDRRSIPIIAGLVVFALIVLVAYRIGFSSSKNSEISESPTPTPTPPVTTGPENPFYIINLQKRQYQASIKIEQDLQATSEIQPAIFTYESDGLTIYGLMIKPTNNQPEPGFPVIILNHGYIEPEQYSTENSYRDIAEAYARQGFLVLKPDYRGHANSDSGENHIFDRVSYAIDVLNLMAGIPEIPEANDQQIFLVGHSMGGDVTLKVLESSSAVKAASLWAPVSISYPESWLYFLRIHQPENVQQIETELKQIFTQDDFAQISPITNTHLITVPIMIHHGTQDESVPYDWSVYLKTILDETDVENTFNTYPGENHNFTKGSWSTIIERDVEFFNAQ